LQKGGATWNGMSHSAWPAQNDETKNKGVIINPCLFS
jgi:hypothetical protein